MGEHAVEGELDQLLARKLAFTEFASAPFIGNAPLVPRKFGYQPADIGLGIVVGPELLHDGSVDDPKIPSVNLVLDVRNAVEESKEASPQHGLSPTLHA